MEITTRHRKSAEQAKPKGRALFALAERKEAPFAAMFAALTLALAAYVKTAFGAAPQHGAEDQQPQAAGPSEEAAPQLEGGGDVPPGVDFAALDEEQPLITGSLPDNDDLGRIGRGPGMLDLSRFFPDADPHMALPHSYLADQPEIQTAQLAPMPVPGAPSLVIPGGGGAGGGGTGGNTGNTGGGGSGNNGNNGGTPVDDDTISGVNFHELFAQLASVIRSFHPTTVKDISNAAIGDWLSQQELYKLRGGETRANLDQAYLVREERTESLLKDADTRQAFIDQHFPSMNGGMPEATLAETPAILAQDIQPEPLLNTDTNTGLL